MQTPREQRPTFFSDPAGDRMAAIVTALSAEVCAVADRLDTFETLMVRKGVLAVGEIDVFEPTNEDAARRRRLHDQFISRVFCVLKDEFDALA